MSLLFAIGIVYVVIYYIQQSKIPGNPILKSLLHRRKTRNLKHELEAGTKIKFPPEKRKFARFGMISDQLDLSQQKITFSSKNESKIISLESLIYDEKILSERCGISKLTFNQGQLAIYCPQCETLFHKDHLTNWLQTTKHCPVCKYIFIN